MKTRPTGTEDLLEPEQFTKILRKTVKDTRTELRRMCKEAGEDPRGQGSLMGLACGTLGHLIAQNPGLQMDGLFRVVAGYCIMLDIPDREIPQFSDLVIHLSIMAGAEVWRRKYWDAACPLHVKVGGFKSTGER